ncbi:MAG: AMIN domain-containing protein [Candidatus Hydrogenedentes bacterium]|nr:AMIN domain-containing protein [Candidatus Hydrogenedentota bacterium]
MSQTRRRTYLAAVAITALTVAMCVTSADPIQKSKRAALHECMARLGQSAADSALAEAAERAASLNKVTADGADTVVLETSGSPLCDVFDLDRGKHIVVDLYGTVNLCADQPIGLKTGSCVRQVRNSLFAVEPQFVSRIVLDMASPATLTVNKTDGRITLSLTPLKRTFDESPTLSETLTAYCAGVSREQGRLAIESAAFDESQRRALSFYAGHSTTGTEIATQAILSSNSDAVRVLRTELDQAVAKSNAAYADLHTRATQLRGRAANGQTTVTDAQEALGQLQSEFDVARSKGLTALAGIRKKQDAARQETAVKLLARAMAPLDEAAQTQRQNSMKTTVAPANDSAISKLAGQLAALQSPASTDSPQLQDSVSRLAQKLDLGAAPKTRTFHLAQAAKEESPEALPIAPFEKLAAAEPTAVAPATEPKASEKAAPTEPVAEKATVEPKTAEKPASPVKEEKKEAADESKKKSEEGTMPEVKTIGKKAGAGVDPLDEPVTINFYQMELANAVSLLAQKAQINVVAGADIKGTVTADIQNVPLRKAMETVLRMNDLGIVEEEGIWRIVSYEEAIAANQVTKMIYLLNAQSDTIKATLEPLILAMPEGKAISLSANPSTNVVIITGPPARVKQLEEMITSLDVAKPSLPTVTEAIKLNYLEAADVKKIVETMLTKGEKGAGVGRVEADEKGRHLIVTDLPVVVEQVKELVKKLDVPVKQVGIHAMIVDAVLHDDSQTGVDWVMKAVTHSNPRGVTLGSLEKANFTTGLGTLPSAGAASFGILTGNIDITATIAAEVNSRNAKILANPVVVTVENKPAEISIVQEFPYQEITQSTQGPPVASTSFKPIGVTMNVTPRITHNNDVIVNIEAKESSVSGTSDTGVPIEDKRSAQSTLRVKDGQTVFIGGLRNHADTMRVKKVPVLGDVPLLNVMFRNTTTDKTNTELLIFLTCQVAEDNLPELTPSEQNANDELGADPAVPDSQRAMFRSMVKPGEMRDPMWKWRRTK